MNIADYSLYCLYIIDVSFFIFLSHFQFMLLWYADYLLLEESAVFVFLAELILVGDVDCENMACS